MYDSKCYDLADVFLTDEPRLRSERNTERLAQAIQDEIENWIEVELNELSARELDDHSTSSHPCPPLKE